VRAIDFEDFFRAEYESVLRALVVALADRPLAEEAAQQAFVDAFAHWSRVRKMDRPAGWAYVAAVRHARHRRPALNADASALFEVDHAEAVIESQDLAALLATLPPRQRLAVVLRYLADLPLEDVARAMGCALGTAKSTVHAALARMKVSAELVAAEEAADAHR
jgi:RNA polymerase sigma-70 factor (ECF subfamily)